MRAYWRTPERYLSLPRNVPACAFMSLSCFLSALLDCLGRDRLAGIDPRVQFAGAVPPRHLAHRDHLDLGGLPGGAELLAALAAQLPHRLHRRLEEFARVELGPRLRCDLAEYR